MDSTKDVPGMGGRMLSLITATAIEAGLHMYGMACVNDLMKTEIKQFDTSFPCKVGFW